MKGIKMDSSTNGLFPMDEIGLFFEMLQKAELFQHKH